MDENRQALFLSPSFTVMLKIRLYRVSQALRESRMAISLRLSFPGPSSRVENEVLRYLSQNFDTGKKLVACVHPSPPL